MYVYIYIYTHIYIYTYIHMYIHISSHIHIHMCVYIYIYIWSITPAAVLAQGQAPVAAPCNIWCCIILYDIMMYVIV